MSDNVEMRFTGNSADGERAIAQLERKYDSLENKLKQLRARTKDAAKQGSDDFAQMGAAVSNVASIVTGLSSSMDVIQAGLRAISAEATNIIEKQAKAAQGQKSLAMVEREMVINLGRDASLPFAKADSEAKRIARKLGMEERDVKSAMSTAFSRRGGLPASETVGFVEAGLTMTPSAEGADVAGASMLLGREFKLTPEQSVGFLMQMQQQSPVKSVPDLAKNMIPTILAMSAFGYDPEQSAELGIAMASRSGDIRGEMTKTATIQLGARLNEVLPGVGLNDAIAQVQASKKLQDEMFKKDFGEAQFKPLFRELLIGGADSKIGQNLAASRAGITDPRQAGPVFEQVISDVEALPNVQSERLQGALKAWIDMTNAGDVAGGRASSVREAFPGMLQAAGVGSTAQFFAQRQLEARTLFGQEPTEAAMQILEPLINEAERYSRNAPTEGDRSQNAEMAKLLKEIRDEMKRFNAVGNKPAAPRQQNVENN